MAANHYLLDMQLQESRSPSREQIDLLEMVYMTLHVSMR